MVIPSTAREQFSIKAGDLLLVVGDRKIKGIGLIKADEMKEILMKVLKGLGEVEDGF